MDQGLCQGVRACAPPVQHIFFAAVINVVFMCFKAGRDIMEALVHLKTKTGAGGSKCRRANPDDVALGHALL